jgi:ERCC4-type nuclease
VRDLGMIRRLAIETCAADASAALEALEVFARRNAAARDPRAWVASRDFDACVDACRERATPQQVEAPAKWALLREALAGATSVAILVATRDQARSVASFLKVGAEAACLRLRRRLVARALPHLPSKASRDTPYQRLVRAELDDALEERNDDGDQALADALALSLEEAEDDAIKAAIAASLARRRSSMLGPPPSRPIDPEETCLSQGPPPDAALRHALALSARDVDDGGLQRALALSAAEARTEVVDLTLSQGSEDRGLSRTADDSQMEATQLEETQLVAPRRSLVDVSASPPDETAVEETQLLPPPPRRSVVDVSATPDEAAADSSATAMDATQRRSVVDVSASPLPDETAVEETQVVDVTASPAPERPPAVYVLTTEQLARTPLDALRPRKVIVYDAHAPSLLRHARRYAASRDVVLERLVVAGSLEETLATQTEAREALALQELRSLPKLASSVRPPAPDAPLIVVDARELRSEVPRALYDRGLRLAVATLTVADFVLSSSLAVERKNVDTNDLHSSLESGRLWTQLRALGAAYSTPTLLVEFRDRSHRLDAPTTYLSLKHTQDRLTKAILEFPRTKLLWAPSPHATAALFAALASGDDQPDVDAAQRHRDDGDAVFRFLDKLPGLEPPRPDLQGCSLAQLASLDTDALTRILGSDRARRFAAFCTRPMEPLPLAELEKNQPKRRRRGPSPPRPRKR